MVRDVHVSAHAGSSTNRRLSWRFAVTQLDTPAAASAEPAHGRPAEASFGTVLKRNISTQAALREQVDRKKGVEERVADAITRFVGSMRFIYVHAGLFGTWIVWNLGFIPGLQPFDASLVVLAMIASVEAIFLGGFILISQNRMQAEADKRAELSLQMGLLAEHEITQIAALLDALAQHLGVQQGRPDDIEEAKQDVDPTAVAAAIERAEEKRTTL
jgi:uncharacterized membrane protein